MTTDAKINNFNGYWDFEIDSNGQIGITESFDTSILRSLYGEKRASADEVIEPNLRRGWIGNDETFENGYKLWLYSQARLTRTNLNRIANEAELALSWLVEDNYAYSIDNVTTEIIEGRVLLRAKIRYTNDVAENLYLPLWQNTGVN